MNLRFYFTNEKGTKGHLQYEKLLEDILKIGQYGPGKSVFGIGTNRIAIAN